MAVLAIWARLVHNRLWQGSLAHEAASLIEAAQRAGLERLPNGWGPWVAMRGQLEGRTVTIRVVASWRGVHTSFHCDKVRLRQAGIVSLSQLDTALGQLVAPR